MSRPVIAVDIDDVLSASAEGFAAYSNKRWGLNITPDDYLEDWATVWGVPHDIAEERAKEIHRVGVIAKYRCFGEAKPILADLKQRYDLQAVTSRRIVIKPETDVWLEKHFPGIFSKTIYAGFWDEIGPDFNKRLSATKAEICRSIGARYLIDDQIKHCEGAAEHGIEAILFGDYSWNRGKEISPGIIRASNWGAIQEHFYAKS